MSFLASKTLKNIPRIVQILRLKTAEFLTDSITTQQLRLLYLVDQHKTNSELAKMMFVSEAAVSKSLKMMIKQGLIKKTDSIDKRSSVLKVTPKGKKLRTKISARLESILDLEFKKLKPFEQEELSRALDKLVEVMEKLHVNY